MTKVNETRSKYVTYWERLDETATIGDSFKTKYSQEIIDRATKLKAYNKAYYQDRKKLENLTAEPELLLDDQDFIEFALQEQYINIVKQIKSTYDIQIALMNIPDPEWAGYSYEEIIAMHENGVDVPKEVFEWAKAQQQADPLSYEMISESEEASPNQGAEDPATIQKKAKECIEKAEAAIEKTQDLFIEHREVARKANRIKKLKEDKYKNEMDEIAKLTEEWKGLNEKSKAGQLTKSENKRLNELSRKLNGKNGTAMKDMQMADAQLDKYLDSFEIIDAKIDENDALITETNDVAKALLKIEKPNSENATTHTVKEKEMTKGLLRDLIHGAKGDALSAATSEAADDLKECNDVVTKVIRGSEGTELTQFAKNYTEAATKTEENTKEVMGDSFNQASQKTPFNKSKDVSSGIPIMFSFMNAILATTLTLLTTAELLVQDKETRSQEKLLNKELKKANKDMKALNREVDETENKKEETKTKEEMFLEELEEVNEKPIENSENNGTDGADPSGSAPSNEGEAEEITANLETLDEEDKQNANSLNKALSKSTKTTNKSKSLAKVLKSKNKDLNKQNKKATKTAQDTTTVGVGTTAKSVITNIIGTDLCATGATMMVSMYPPTVKAGVKLFTLGMGFLQLGALEIATGTTATATGLATLVVSSNVDGNIKDADQSEKDANKAVKDNQKEIATSAKAVSEDDATAAAAASSSSAATSSEGETSEAAADQETTNATTEAAESEDSTGDSGNSDDSGNNNAENSTTEEGTQESDEKDAKGSDNGDSSPSVSIGYSIPHCIAANATVFKSTAELTNAQNKVEKDQDKALGDEKLIEKLNKKLTKNQALVEQKEQSKAKKIMSIIRNLEATSTSIEQANNSGETDKAAIAQVDVESQYGELESTLKDNEAIDTFEKTATENSKKITNLENSKNETNTSLENYDKKIEDHLNISKDAIIVGSGTARIGKTLSTFAISTLLPNPITHTAGVVTLALGQAHTYTGYGTMAIGAAGIMLNEAASNNKKDINASLKEILTTIKDGKKSLKKSEETVTAKEKETEKALNDIPDEATSSAAASSNANTTSSVETDDKVDRKLARFNADSIIESKKKKKKVQGISASSRG